MFASSVTAQENDLLSPSRNDLKITMLSLGSGSTRVTYERAFNELNSGEVTVGIIGLGWVYTAAGQSKEFTAEIENPLHQDPAVPCNDSHTAAPPVNIFCFLISNGAGLRHTK